ncbi:MAG: acetylxylan esterase [Planctomycetia bacterium]|nr:acetylxylan esterase [Planctomycetia bacterium]
MVAVAAACNAGSARADGETINYDEAKVPDYVLPDPLVMQDARSVTSAAMWRKLRRPEILELFCTQVYGRRPPTPEGLRFDVTEDTPAALAGKATRKRIRVDFSGRNETWPGVKLTLIVPGGAKTPVPAFVGMHLFDSKSDEPLPGRPLEVEIGEKLPGSRVLDVILERGYAIGTLDANDFCPDDKERFREGALAHFFPGRTGPPGVEEPGAISVWAWGLSRALDYLETDPAIDAKRVAVIGHSRMGKTALWAGAQDERFALVISNNSGCGGAALSRRVFGETVARINGVFPHWFCGNFSKYNGREGKLPVDQHELVALIAPRPVYIASAQEDLWADPRGEFLSAVGAERVYHLLGKPGLETTEMPPAGRSIGNSIGYHLRVGKHALTDYDWLRYLDFADRHFAKPAQAGPRR